MAKKTIGQVMVGVYILGSLVYIGYTQWTNFKTHYAEEAFQNGQTDVIERLITQAEDPDCQPFSVYTANNEVQLVNVTCVQTDTDEETVNEQ